MKALLLTLAAAALLALAGCRSCTCRPCACDRDCPCDHCPKEKK